MAKLSLARSYYNYYTIASSIDIYLYSGAIVAASLEKTNEERKPLRVVRIFVFTL
jgi:hypothetical protein